MSCIFTGTRVVPWSWHYTGHRLRIQYWEFQAFQGRSRWADGTGTGKIFKTTAREVGSH